MKKIETVDYNVKITWHAISRMYNQEGMPFDVTASTGFVLLNIDSEIGTPATKIAPLLGLEARSLTRMLKTLEEKGLVRKEQDPKDGRSVRIFLTEQGRVKKEISRKVVLDFNNKVRDFIPEKKLKVFFEVMTDINKVLDAYNEIKMEANELSEIKQS
jgi:DNA-binding MarR family transcriptional regulator